MPLSAAAPVTFVMTRDRKVAEVFYGETLGLKRVPGNAFSAVYDLAGVPLHVTEASDHTPSPHPVLGWSVTDMEAIVQALTAKGVAFNIYDGMGQDALGIWTSPDGASKIAFFNDPDGNALSLTQG